MQGLTIRGDAARTKMKMAITEPPQFVFGKVSLDIVGALNKTEFRNKYLLTVQDQLSKYLIGVFMLSQGTGNRSLSFC